MPLLSMEVDSLDGAADGYYAPGEVSLSDAVAWANAVPGADTITFSENLLERIEKEVAAEIDDAVDFAEEGTLEAVSDLTRFVYSEVAP